MCIAEALLDTNNRGMHAAQIAHAQTSCKRENAGTQLCCYAIKTVLRYNARTAATYKIDVGHLVMTKW